MPTYFPHVDGLRALAVLAVVIYHLRPAWLPGGFVGVDMFFVISGFVVTASLAGHRDETLGGFLGRFYARRLARLAPALALMLVVVTLLYVTWVPRAWFNRAAETVGQAAFWGLGNIVIDRHAVNYFEPRAELNPFTHTWSLGVEEQFYLVAPLLLFAALGSGAARPGLRRLAIAAIAALAAASLAALFAFGVTKGPRYVFYSLVFRFWELAAGVLLFLGGPQLARLPPRLWRVAAPVGAALVLATLLLPRPGAYPWLRGALAAGGALLLIGPPGVADGRLRALLASRPALWLGLRSYSLYLWHWPIDVLARWTLGLAAWPHQAAALALSFAAAAASYRFVEQPVRTSRRLLAWQPGVRIVALLAMLGTGWALGALLLAGQPWLGRGLPARQPADWYGDRQLLRHERAAGRRCDPQETRSALAGVANVVVTYAGAACADPAAPRLVVLGDSHATALQPLLEQLAAERAMTVRIYQAPGCGYLDLQHPMLAEADAHCHRMARAATQEIAAQARRGDIVFLPSLRVPRQIQLGGERRQDQVADVYGRTPAERHFARLALDDAPRWLRPFLDAGMQVIVPAPTPVLAAHPFRCVDAFNRGNPECAGGLRESRADQERHREPVMRALQRLAQDHPGLTIWDPLPLLCSATHCDALRAGRPLFFDADHLSPYANLLLLPAFTELVDRLGQAR